MHPDDLATPALSRYLMVLTKGCGSIQFRKAAHKFRHKHCQKGQLPEVDLEIDLEDLMHDFCIPINESNKAYLYYYFLNGKLPSKFLVHVDMMARPERPNSITLDRPTVVVKLTDAINSADEWMDIWHSLKPMREAFNQLGVKGHGVEDLAAGDEVKKSWHSIDLMLDFYRIYRDHRDEDYLQLIVDASREIRERWLPDATTTYDRKGARQVLDKIKRLIEAI